MTNQFSIEIHDHISRKIKYTEDKIQQAKELKNREQERFYEGRIEVLSEFKNFIENNYIPRLPRRIRKGFI
jgi:hypothetical protein